MYICEVRILAVTKMCACPVYHPNLLIPMLGLGIEEEQPDYDMDSEDEVWLNAQSKDRVSSWFPFLYGVLHHI